VNYSVGFDAAKWIYGLSGVDRLDVCSDLREAGPVFAVLGDVYNYLRILVTSVVVKADILMSISYDHPPLISIPICTSHPRTPTQPLSHQHRSIQIHHEATC